MSYCCGMLWRLQKWYLSCFGERQGQPPILLACMRAMHWATCGRKLYRNRPVGNWFLFRNATMYPIVTATQSLVPQRSDSWFPGPETQQFRTRVMYVFFTRSWHPLVPHDGANCHHFSIVFVSIDLIWIFMYFRYSGIFHSLRMTFELARRTSAFGKYAPRAGENLDVLAFPRPLMMIVGFFRRCSRDVRFN